MTASVQLDFEGYLEDFRVGDVYRHARGKTISELDNVLITNMVLNTAEPHFNEHAASGDPMFKQRVVFGGVTLAMVVGLTAQDTTRHAIAELGMSAIKLHAPVHHGDTIYVYSEVLANEPNPARRSGIVTFMHRGYNQHEQLVFSGQRRVSIRSRETRAEIDLR